MLIYPIGESGQSLKFQPNVLKHFKSWQQKERGSNEAGGQLFGYVEKAHVIISCATGPRSTDKRHVFSYIGDRIAERREIKHLHRKKLHYLGDWHTHPEEFPTPSQTDITSMGDIFSKSEHELNSFLMVIVGTAQFPQGLHVSMHDTDRWMPLCCLQ